MRMTSALAGGVVIVAIDRKSVASAAQLSALEVVRRGRMRTVAVALGDAPA
jgi:hypothetical protein